MHTHIQVFFNNSVCTYRFTRIQLCFLEIHVYVTCYICQALSGACQSNSWRCIHEAMSILSVTAEVRVMSLVIVWDGLFGAKTDVNHKMHLLCGSSPSTVLFVVWMLVCWLHCFCHLCRCVRLAVSFSGSLSGDS